VWYLVAEFCSQGNKNSDLIKVGMSGTLDLLTAYQERICFTFLETRQFEIPFFWDMALLVG
jgi:hypothetical protein